MGEDEEIRRLEAENRELLRQIQESHQTKTRAIKAAGAAEALTKIQRDLGIILGSTSDMQESLEASLEAVMKVEGVDSGGVYLIEEEGLRLKCHIGEFEGLTAHHSQEASRTVAEGKPRYMPYGGQDENERPLELGMIPLMTKEGVIGALNVASHTDIPQSSRTALEMIATQIGTAIARVKAEAARKQSEEEYRTLFENVNVGVYRSTPELPGRYLTVNPALAQMLGYSVSELLRINITDLYIEPSQREAFVKRIRAEGKARNVEIMLKRKDGRTIICASTAQASYKENGEIAWFDGMLEDITERKLAEKLERQIQQASRLESVGTLAAAVAHDFNNTLTAIVAFAALSEEELNEIISGQSSDLTSILTSLKYIKDHALRSAEQTKRLTDLAKEKEVDVKPTNLNKLIEQSLKLFETTNKGIVIEREFYDQLWRTEVDREQIKQHVLMNIYINAMQAMKGSGTLRILTDNRTLSDRTAEMLQIKPGQYVMISIRDNGTGMDEETKAKAFEPFFTTKKEGGSGLGLYSAHTIIKAHGGAIEIDSAPAAYTDVRIYLPASDKYSDSERINLAEALNGREKVLFVDDEAIVRRVISRHLQKLGYNVATADGGEEALEMYEDHDIVVLDLGMPGMGGIETLKALREKNHHVKAIIASGLLDPKIEPDMHINGYIQKPYDGIALSKKIREALDSKSE